ncbi:MAG: hypothetical protein ACK5LS_01305 [Propioniciclava sp.]
MDSFLVDCADCSMRGIGCADCVVSVLLGVPEGPALDAGERDALAALSAGGLLPPLRLETVRRGVSAAVVPGSERVS